MGWRMARLRKMEWLALAGLALPPHSLALSGADPAFKRRKHGSSPDKSAENSRNRPRLGVHQVGEGLRPAGIWQ